MQTSPFHDRRDFSPAASRRNVASVYEARNCDFARSIYDGEDLSGSGRTGSPYLNNEEARDESNEGYAILTEIT